MLTNTTFAVQDFTAFKLQLLNWANRFNSCCFLDNHLYPSPWHVQECLLAVGTKASVHAQAGNALYALQTFLDEHKGQWVFGNLGFGLQQETEQLLSRHTSQHLGFDDLHFFVPELVLQCRPGSVDIMAASTEAAQHAYESICTTSADSAAPIKQSITVQPRVSEQEYLQVIDVLKQHIKRGDCYEINYCQEFVADNVQLNPVDLYARLSRLSPNPFSCYYKVEQSHLACASPERYLLKQGHKIISQPIKGTAQRNLQNAVEDAAEKKALQQSQKDQRENVMVVDLVRNDLAKLCNNGTVKVQELFGVYSYPQVHQMISTIEGDLRNDVTFADIIQATFPMGSMTGAPKKRVLELIDKYEVSARGIFSGAVGYFHPSGNFDFNVVIRSMVYNEAERQLSFHVGSGITYYSNAAAEYEECKWKAAAIQKVLAEISA
ncbi:MAG TPA: anthranilate synthase component I family protein [Phnomibacter sp.]|nr:anthranilate synthase component I family protein [Phnomibacter sp.]